MQSDVSMSRTRQKHARSGSREMRKEAAKSNSRQSDAQVRCNVAGASETSWSAQLPMKGIELIIDVAAESKIS